MRGVDRVAEQRRHDRAGVFQIAHRLEQGNDIQILIDAGIGCHQQHGQHIARAGCHADHVGVDGLRPQPLARVPDQAEQFHRLVGLVAEIEAGGVSGRGLYSSAVSRSWR